MQIANKLQLYLNTTYAFETNPLYYYKIITLIILNKNLAFIFIVHYLVNRNLIYVI